MKHDTFKLKILAALIIVVFSFSIIIGSDRRSDCKGKKNWCCQIVTILGQEVIR